MSSIKHGATRKSFLCLLVALSLILLAACGGGAAPDGGTGAQDSPAGTESPGDPPESQDAADSASGGKTSLSVGMKAEINGTGHPYDNGTPATAISGLICEPLTDRAADGSVVGLLAESWEAVDDVTWVFKIREGVSFTNGEPLTAHSVAGTFEILSRDEITWTLKGDITTVVQSVEATGDYEVTVVTHEPFGALPLRFVLFRILPHEYFDEVGDEGFTEHPVGTGPYKHVEFSRGSHYKVEANEDYWDGAPQIKEITFNVMLDSAARVAALEAGDVDWILGVPINEMERLGNSDKFETTSYATTFSMFGQFNTYNNEALKDVRVRKAINMSVDIDTIIDVVYGGAATKSNNMCFIPAFEGYDAGRERDPYDPDAAKALLEEAGYGDGLTVTMHVVPASHPGITEVAQIMAAQMAEIGVTLEIQEIENGLLRELYATQETADIVITALGGWQGDGTVVADLALTPGQRYSVWDDDAISEMRQRVEREVDEAARLQLISDMTDLLDEQCPGIVMWQTHENYAYSSALKNWVPYATTNMVFRNAYFD